MANGLRPVMAEHSPVLTLRQVKNGRLFQRPRPKMWIALCAPRIGLFLRGHGGRLAPRNAAIVCAAWQIYLPRSLRRWEKSKRAILENYLQKRGGRQNISANFIIFSPERLIKSMVKRFRLINRICLFLPIVSPWG